MTLDADRSNQASAGMAAHRGSAGMIGSKAPTDKRRSATSTGDEETNMTPRYFEDFAVGQAFQSKTYEVTAERIKGFAAQFDPQPFHLDEEAAKDTFFKGLAASGWHTAAIMMRLLVESDLNIVGGTIGAGVEDLRWPRPVRPGDVIRLKAEVVETRRSRTRPALGIVKVRLTMLNQHDQPVQIATPALMVPTRDPTGSAP